MNGKHIDPKKLANINEWNYPTTGKQIQRYLGFFNFFQEKGYHPLQAIHAELPGDHIAIDLAGQLPASIVTDSRGNQRTMTYILVVVDVCTTRFVYLRAIINKATITVAQELFHLFCDIGFPKILQSDNGSEFVNEVIRSLTTHMQTAIDIIRKRFEDNPTDWASQVPVAQLYMNTTIVDLHRSSPYSLFFARRYNGIGDFTDTETNLMDSEKLLERLEYMTKIVFPVASECAQET
ncbi:hypothetical protein BGZ65_006117 [Modicella reniformis]|uniref:Integrase catalytic domain-containing protein n=1 Tax=Modicella reniformis TaxID=1440133 RepID=A0A9P6IWJ3_9FUNG|nr:hypothetical protein BGZ65_006117 [Modicella reniformis]